MVSKPARTLSISGLKPRVLKLSFLSLKMMVKSGLEFILKFTEYLQRYLLSCQANSAIQGRYFCTGQQQLWRGSVNFKMNSRPLFTIIFKLKNDNFKTRDFSPLIKRVITGVIEHLNFLLPFIAENTKYHVSKEICFSFFAKWIIVLRPLCQEKNG